MTEATSMLDAAIACATYGFHVFPAPPGERKSYKSAAFSGGRKWGATNNPIEIAQDWRTWPDANVGIVCGPISGLLVVDLDGASHGDGVDGMAEWAKLEAKYGPAPETVEVETPSGGRHIYFRWPDGLDIRNSASKLARGIDVRAAGGMVLAPPSVKPGVGPYRWRADPDVGIADAPEWLIALLTAPTPSAAPPPVYVNGSAPADAWARRALDAEVSAVLTAPEGQRNDRLNTAAFNLGQIVGGGSLSQSAVEAALARAAAGAGLSAKEVSPTIASGLAAGTQAPRRPKEAERVAVTAPTAPRPLYVVPAAAPKVQADYDSPSLELLVSAAPEGMPDVTGCAEGVLAEAFYYMAGAMRRDWPDAAFAVALQLVGIAIGRNYETWSGLRSNLYTVVLAGSGWGKSSVYSPAVDLMIQAGMQEMVGAERIMSDSGLIAEVFGASEHKKLYFIDEFGHMLQQCTARGAGGHVRKIVTELTRLYSKAGGYFSGSAYADGSRGSAMDCPHVNVFGMATPRQFWEAFGSGAIEDGTLARFSIVKAATRPERRDLGAGHRDTVDAARAALAPRLGALAAMKQTKGNLGEPEVVRVMPAQGALEAWTAIEVDAERISLEAETRHPDKDIGGILARVAETAAKVALIFAVARNPERPTIAASDILAGRRMAWWFAHVAIEGVMVHVSDSIHQANSQSVLAFIQTGEGAMRTRRDVTRKFRSLTPRELDEAVKSLMDSDLIAAEMRDTGGRPTLVLVALQA